MKRLEDIKQSRRLIIAEISDDGFSGIISMPLWKGSIICSWGGGWEHCSVSPSKKNIIPTWDDMCMIKDLIFKEDEAVIQIHPPKDEYVNNMPNCLHLWRYLDGDMVLPPSFMVGLRKGQTMAELDKEIKNYYAARGEKI
jgi:hypothetical protein